MSSTTKTRTESIKIGFCYRCGSDRHRLPLLPGEQCECTCHVEQQNRQERFSATLKEEIADIERQTERIAGIRELGLMPEHQTPLGATLDRERVGDAHENVTDWLGDATSHLNAACDAFSRAHKAACEHEPVTAMVIAPLIGQARQVEQRLTELIEVRKETTK